MDYEYEMGEDRPITCMKRADAKFNRVIIPKFFIDKNGRDFYMEVYKDRIILIPVKKEEGE